MDKARVYLPLLVVKIRHIYGVLQKPSSEKQNQNMAMKMKEKEESQKKSNQSKAEKKPPKEPVPPEKSY